MTQSCLFCRIVAGEIPSPRLAESDLAIAIRDINPQAPFHALVLPKSHVQSLAHASDSAMLGDVLALAQRVAREAGLDDGGYRVVLNTGDNGGQTVQHLHAHVMGGRAMSWPPG
ncbi:MAG: histidine triad nucleotide-binding protein [Phycisphaerae bacterium]|nr:histidine triad nucleotide-binding protein [Gemmatimonadaceae bacterium]